MSLPSQIIEEAKQDIQKANDRMFVAGEKFNNAGAAPLSVTLAAFQEAFPGQKVELEAFSFSHGRIPLTSTSYGFGIRV